MSTVIVIAVVETVKVGWVALPPLLEMTQVGAVTQAVLKVKVQVVAAEPVVKVPIESLPATVGAVPQLVATGGTLETIRCAPFVPKLPRGS